MKRKYASGVVVGVIGTVVMAVAVRRPLSAKAASSGTSVTIGDIEVAANAAFAVLQIRDSKVTAAQDLQFAKEYYRVLDENARRKGIKLHPSAFVSDARYAANLRKTLEALLRGGVKPEIVGGTPTVDYPDCVAVGKQVRDRVDWGCSGVLVASNVVVTAGHCFDDGYKDLIYIGSNVAQPGKTVRVKQREQPDGYQGRDEYFNDLTVLILEEDVKDVAPRAFANNEDICAASYVRVVGFGFSDPSQTGPKGQKQRVDVVKVSDSCDRPEDPEQYGCHGGIELIAADPESKRDSCLRDSGGPAYVAVKGGWAVAGFVSRRVANSSLPCGSGGIYVRSDKFEDWIRSVPNGHWPTK